MLKTSDRTQITASPPIDAEDLVCVLQIGPGQQKGQVRLDKVDAKEGQRELRVFRQQQAENRHVGPPAIEAV